MAAEHFDLCVIGAGTMGRGIAQVCAQQGMAVLLADASLERAAAGKATIDRQLARLVEKGRMAADRGRVEAPLLLRLSLAVSFVAAKP